jgi:predicted enzyme related to lactoylglutathione lyase
MGNPVNWFEIYTSDYQRAKKFYSTVFKVELTDLPMSEGGGPANYATFPSDMTGPGSSGALAKMDMMKPGPGGTMLYFNTEEILTEQGRVEAAGGKIMKPKTAIGEYGFIAIIEDTEGNFIGLHSMK